MAYAKNRDYTTAKAQPEWKATMNHDQPTITGKSLLQFAHRN